MTKTKIFTFLKYSFLTIRWIVSIAFFLAWIPISILLAMLSMGNVESEADTKRRMDMAIQREWEKNHK